MPMASETLGFTSKKEKDLSGENGVENQADHIGRKNSFSHMSQCHKKSDSAEMNSGESRLGKKLLATNSVENAYSKPTQEPAVSEAVVDNGTALPIDVNADGNACPHDKNGSCEACFAAQLQHHSRLRRENTLQDLYMMEYNDDEDDENDHDWALVDTYFINKWFCTNCTMPNSEDACNCHGCGEHKDYGIPHQEFSQDQISSDSAAVRCQDSSSETGTAVGFDERMLLHSEVEMKSHPHPERPDRLRAIAASLASAGLFPGKCSLIPAREITREELQTVHSIDHIEAVDQSSQIISSYFTPDTYANEHSACSARIAAGLCADLAISIMSGRSRNGFALVRPPGHHAGVKEAMGFCLHNNAAVAALAAQRAGAKKVLIVDWDVHHGNGTQEIFDGNKSVLYISLHRHEDGRFYPGTGAADQVGVMDGKGYSVNIPWSCGGVGDNDYIFAFQHIVLPIASEFHPDMTIISAGFDAARGDPLGCCDVTPTGFAQMTHMLSSLSQGKLLAILEGGYNLQSISSSATAVVKVLLGENPVYDMSAVKPSIAGIKTLLQVTKVQLTFWPILESTYLALKIQWPMISLNRRKLMKKRKHLLGPVWWKWGSKRFAYKLLYGDMHSTGHRFFKRVSSSHLSRK